MGKAHNTELGVEKVGGSIELLFRIVLCEASLEDSNTVTTASANRTATDANVANALNRFKLLGID